jgi:hypothetical protein
MQSRAIAFELLHSGARGVPAESPLKEMPLWLSGEAPLPSLRELEAKGLRRHHHERTLDVNSVTRDVARHLDLWKAREAFTKTYGFAIPCKEAIDTLVALGPIVEVGAGTGYWSRLIDAAGGQVVATDLARPNGYGFSVGTHRNVLASNATAAARAFPDRAVLCVWPCYGKRWSAAMAASLKPGRVLALVGEGYGGCTGSDRLFDILEKDFEEIGGCAIPRFPYINDHLTIHRRRDV